MRINVKYTLPKMKFGAKDFVNAVERAMRTQTGPGVQRVLEGTVNGWENKPEFRFKQTTTSNKISILIYADGKNADLYSLVNKGSPAHIIRPRQSGGLLRFQPGYSAATKPRSLMSKGKKRSGDFVSASVVSHPGFEAREFDVTTADYYEPKFQREMRASIKGIVK